MTDPLGPVTDEELAALPAKTKQHPEVVRLYQEHPYLEAYAIHTDRRVKELGLAGAVGSANDWERHGKLQSEFLISQGLKPHHRLLDYGCGTGRLARKIVPYLEPYKYAGVDLSAAATTAAKGLAIKEGWGTNRPAFHQPLMMGTFGAFDFIWAFSVFIHLPQNEVRNVFAAVRRLMHERSVFLFSYVPEKVAERTGFKQFRHTLGFIVSCADEHGLTFERVTEWTGEQHIAKCTRRDGA